MKTLTLLCLLLAFSAMSQSKNCQFGSPVVTVDFGAGSVQDLNTSMLSNYGRVGSSCPTDGHYSYTSSTSNCFRGDWHTLPQDHTPGDAAGNMLLVNASYEGGTFFSTVINGLKSNTTYEFAAWITNVCRISDKCPFPLLPNIIVRLQSPSGKIVAQFRTGEIYRLESPQWKRYKAVFNTPPATSSLVLTMINSTPGGCGNDLAIDDLSFRECIIKPVATAAGPKAPLVAKPQAPVAKKSIVKKEQPKPLTKPSEKVTLVREQINMAVRDTVVIKSRQTSFPAPPPILIQRSNTVVKQFQTEAGEIKLDVYDNGEIDGDTVSIYHNNKLVVSKAKLSQKPITIRIDINPNNPHHELIMVAENLGTIPPNTSLMMVTAENKRYQVFISSTEQKNGKVIFDLKE